MELFRKLFQAMTLRERAWLTLFIWGAAFIGLNVTYKQVKLLRSGFAKTASDLQVQELILATKPDTDRDLAAALQRVDKSQTVSLNDLIEKLNRLSRTVAAQSEKESFPSSITKARTTGSDIFDVHSVHVNIRGAVLADLIRFNRYIQREAPYIGIDQAALTPLKSDPRKVNATFVVASFELVE